MSRTTLGRMALVAGLAVASVASAGVTTQQFLLSDHPDGSAALPTYGLRLDGLVGSGVNSFTFNQFNDVVLTVTDDGSMITIDIEGTIFGGQHDGMGGYVGGGNAYAIDFTYAVNVEENAGGWRVLGSGNTQNTGTLTLLGSMDPTDIFTITDNNNNAFIFAPDGHRLAGDNSSFVGRGWLTTNDNGSNTSGTQDWLFTAEEMIVPAPGSIALAGLGSVFAFGRRRRG